MGDIGTATRRSPRGTDVSPGSCLQSSSKGKKNRSMNGSASKGRSVSSPPYKSRSKSRDSESQSSPDRESTKDLSCNYKAENLENHHLLPKSSNSVQDRGRDEHGRSNAKPYVRGPNKPTKEGVHTENGVPGRLSYLPLTPSVPTMLGLVSILVAIPVLLVIAELVSRGNKTSHSRTLGDIEDDVIRDLDKLRSETRQEMSFWRSLYSGLTTVTEPAPRQPLVLLLAVPQDASQTAVCLAHHLTDIVTKAFGALKSNKECRLTEAFGDDSVVKHDTISHLQMEWADHKLELDNQLQHLSSTHAAVIYNLERMPPKTATLLHGYFDNDNAPHKRAVIVVLLELELHYTSVAEEHLDLTVERRLHELWRQDLGQDDIPGLISRVAVQPVLVKPESKFVLNKLCPL
ncbi:hypothetical protein FHG87_013558 [Trinorchestia longiramus]|nr:hypothetical protein FHG87_013558 [Trinorchestia longiramus]